MKFLTEAGAVVENMSHSMPGSCEECGEVRELRKIVGEWSPCQPVIVYPEPRELCTECESELTYMSISA